MDSAVLFIRPVYETLYEELMRRYERVITSTGTTGPPKKWLLLGVPGIGKSAFGQYVSRRM